MSELSPNAKQVIEDHIGSYPQQTSSNASSVACRSRRARLREQQGDERDRRNSGAIASSNS